MPDTASFSLARAPAYRPRPMIRKRAMAQRMNGARPERRHAGPAGCRAGWWCPPAAFARALNTGTTGEGAELVGQATDAFAGALRAATVAGRAGATLLTGLRGDVSVPTITAGAAAEWIAEGAPATGQTPTMARGVIEPKTVAATVAVSRRLLLQAEPAVAQLVAADLVAALGAEIDAAALGASGDAAAPNGLRQALDAAKTPFSAATPSGANMLALESAVLAANVPEADVAFVMGPVMAETLKATELLAGSGCRMIFQDGKVVDRPALVTPAMPASEIIAGGWRDLVIAQWGGIDMRLDRATGAATDTLTLRAFADVGFLVRRTGSFAYGVAP
ncbi:MAG: phage major capsid protein [Roseovarius sp.]|nr:phage major capsid protein [Roseovarius sp.]